MENTVKLFKNFAEIIDWIGTEFYTTETQKQIAKKLGISEKTYFDYKAGREPKKNLLAAKRKILSSIKKDLGFRIEKEEDYYKITTNNVKSTERPVEIESSMELQNKELFLENQMLKNMIIKLNQRIFDLEK